MAEAAADDMAFVGSLKHDLGAGEAILSRPRRTEV